MNRILGILVLMAAGSNAYGQYSLSGTATGEAQISAVTSITVSAPNGTGVSVSSVPEMQQGKSVSGFTQVAIKSNAAWQVYIRAGSTYFTPLSIGASATMPASVLRFRLNGSGSAYIPLSTTDQLLSSGSAGNNAASGNTFSMDVLFIPGFSYPGGIYNLGLLFTVAQP
jgi:hypothetical protein